MNAPQHAAAPAIDTPLERFRAEGVTGAIPYLSVSQCQLLMRHLRSSPPPPEPLVWGKGRAASDRLFYDIATQPQALDLIRALLGPDAILWGAGVVAKKPGKPHVWHADIETSGQAGSSLTLWIGVENTHCDSTIELIAGSHHVGKPVQQVAAEHGLLRADVASEMALAWVREADPNARIVRPVASDGQAVAFDGRVWHATFNCDSAAARTAIVLQYAAADMPVYIPDFTQLEWPFRLNSQPRPSVIPVLGEPNKRANRIVTPPRYEAGNDEVALGTHVYPFKLPLAEDPERKWKPYRITRGRTRSVGSMGMHISVLSAGHSPHPPHEHKDEELLIILDGGADLHIVDRADGAESSRRVPVEAGTFAYYPAYCMHTIENQSTEPVTYLMFRWSGASFDSECTLPCQIHEFGRLIPKDQNRPFTATMVFEGQTSYLRKLHAHTSFVIPGGGYDEHVDGHDVALVLQTGTIETLGRIVEAPGVVYYSAGEPHGLRNVGDAPARYLVFELHSPATADLDSPVPFDPSPYSHERRRLRIEAIRKLLHRSYRRTKRMLGRKAGAAGYIVKLFRRFGRTRA